MIDSDEADLLRRLSQDATVHEVFWLINNFNRLYYAVDGVVVTELDVLCPQERWGADPDALTDHLDALHDLSDRERGPGPDWETAMATVESLTGLGFDAEWFDRPSCLRRSTAVSFAGAGDRLAHGCPTRAGLPCHGQDLRLAVRCTTRPRVRPAVPRSVVSASTTFNTSHLPYLDGETTWLGPPKSQMRASQLPTPIG